MEKSKNIICTALGSLQAPNKIVFEMLVCEHFIVENS